jgi:hypothetical protein
MDIIGIKKKTDAAIDDPIVRNEAQNYSVRTRLAFLPDQVIGRSWFFRLLTLVYYYTFVYFHAFESMNQLKNFTSKFDVLFLYCIVVGMERIDRNQGCLFIARHSSHNGEILGTVVTVYHMTGIVLR